MFILLFLSCGFLWLQDSYDRMPCQEGYISDCIGDCIYVNGYDDRIPELGDGYCNSSWNCEEHSWDEGDCDTDWDTGWASDNQSDTGNNQSDTGVSPSGDGCCYEIKLLDSYGDGWDGAYLTLYINSSSYYRLECQDSYDLYEFCLDYYDSFELDYTSGAYDSENSFYIYQGSNLLYSASNPNSGFHYGNSCE